MSVRYRLFLIVGSLFFIAFLSSFFLETFLTHKNLHTASDELKEKIIQEDLQKKTHYEKFLHQSIVQIQDKVNSLLKIIGTYPEISAYFSPASPIPQGTWTNSAKLIDQNRWVDFVQNTQNGQTLSLIATQGTETEHFTVTPIRENLSWIQNEKGAFIGVKLPIVKMEGQEIVSKKMSQEFPDIYLLYSVDQLWQEGASGQSLLSNPSDSLPFSTLPYIEDYAIDMRALRAHLKSAEQCVQTEQASPPPKSASAPKLSKYREQFDRLFLINLYISLFQSGLFGPPFFCEQAPVGIVLDEHGIFKNSVFSISPFLKEPQDQSLTLISSPDGAHLYLGSTKQLQNSHLTVGVDINGILRDLALTAGQFVSVATGGHWVSAMNEDGHFVALEDFPIETMLAQKFGTIPAEGSDLFFLHLTPFPDCDLHFFLLNPIVKEFSLMQSIQEGSQKMINSVSFNMRIVACVGLLAALVLLHNLSRKMTQPIAQLATAAEQIGRGRIADVKLPQLSSRRSDEITTLCRSFDQMVQHLQEKERVRGVLNKVVSPEIAAEILKGSVHLGGEEREVTVLFADIRNFTKLTQKMPPSAVIDLLNTCMTKISLVIDQHHGVIDKYVGDEVMALFGAPLPQENSALHAVQSALAIIEVLKAWNSERSGPELQMGIGIHTGKMLTGNMGAEDRLNYTVIGSNVNLASRICDAASGMEILISSEVLNAPEVKEQISSIPLAPIHFKGFDEAKDIYRVEAHV